MKLFLSILLLAIAAGTNPETKGKMQPVDGKLIFHYSIPENDYSILGEVEPGAVLNNTPKLLLKALLNKAEKKFPEGNALIVSDNMETAKVILLK